MLFRSAVVLNAWKIVSVDGHGAKAAKEDGTVASDPDLLEGFTFEVDFEDLDGASVPLRSHKQKLINVVNEVGGQTIDILIPIARDDDHGHRIGKIF